MLTERNVQKYYPDSKETPKFLLNQAPKNVRSAKPESKAFQEVKDSLLHSEKVCNLYTSVYEVRETLFSDQTGQFPNRSISGNRYIMVAVEINSSVILFELIKNRTDAKLMRAYRSIMLWLRWANVMPKKHVLDNKISEAMKSLI
ncbi:hypothetical protein ACHAWF_010250 [Thalassiosira exigua]